MRPAVSPNSLQQRGTRGLALNGVSIRAGRKPTSKGQIFAFNPNAHFRDVQILSQNINCCLQKLALLHCMNKLQVTKSVR